MSDTKKSRVLAVDILRGITVSGMILVNNPGGECYYPLDHAEWIGLTPTDLVFPFFMFIMGITTYLSLKKYNFEWSLPSALKILKRGLLLWFIGLAIAWLLTFVRGLLSDDNATLGLWEKICVSANTLDRIRILGVLPRLGICYALAALVALTVRHKFIPWLIALLFIGYFILLETCNGYAHDAGNILAIVDDAILGHSHVYRWDTPDPEGILSTIPSLGHVLIGFMVGRGFLSRKALGDKIEYLFVVGTILMFAGFLLSYGCPISKKIWTPTFALVTCGMGSMTLALLTWLVDKHQFQNGLTRFFQVFGVNPLATYIIADLLIIPIYMLPLFGGKSLQDVMCQGFLTFLPEKMASLAWALFFVLVTWSFGLYLFKKKIYIKL